jgi:secondary thiamine-phosphate synthase enzyme
MEVLHFKTKGLTDIVDITDEVQKVINKKNFSQGVVYLFVLGSTAALTTIEADDNLYQDLKELLEKIIPYQKNYHHHKTWGDDNGASHLRASLFGPSLSVPVKSGKLFLGAWQRIVLIDFDTREREREIILSLTTED